MSEYPPDWRRVRLRDAGQWLSGGTPSTANPRYWGGVIPWISSASLKDFEVQDSERRVTGLGAISGTKLVPAGTTIFVVRGMSLKSEFRVGVAQREIAFGQDCKAIVAAQGIDPVFLAHAVKARSAEVLRLVDEAGHGTGRLPTDQLCDLVVGVPSELEQRAIVEILSSVDTAIRATEQLVAKLGQAKLGLLYDLLTRGIANSGRLRDVDIRSESYQDLNGYRLPLTWRLAEVGSVGQVRLGRQRSPKDEAGRFMFPYLRVANVFDGYIDYSDVLRMNFSPRERKLYGLRMGDLLLNEGQSLELVGRCAIYDGPSGEFCFQNTLVRYRCSDSLLSRFAYMTFKRWLLLGRFMGTARQTTSIAHLGADRFSMMLIPVPSIAEQEAIVETFDLFDKRLNHERALLNKLRQLGHGLADDLLTGRVRPSVEGDVAV
jgi:type I restriction enzyme, S subunit